MKKKINIKSKKTLVFALPALFLLSFGVSLAVSHDRATMANNFKLGGTYETLFVETFDSPQNWITCETIDKSLAVTNDTDSSGSISVRLKLEEQWIAADGTTVLPLVSAASGLTMAQINFTPNSGWTKQGDYYYYNSDLAKNATTDSLITGVTLNCNANIDSVAGADSAYGDATYHLKITAQAEDVESGEAWGDIAEKIEKQANPDSNINYTQKATIATGNGNGVNRYTENGQDVYYFRGEVNNNNVIWADKCWKIVRTTATGGTKMIYNGLPSDVVVDGETIKQCNATGTDSQITVNVNGIDTNTFAFNSNYLSPADVGYMYGTRIEYSTLSAGSTSFTFSNNVSRSGNTYTLDTSANQSISGTWADERTNAAVKYHYFCTDGSTTCDNTKIGYIHDFSENSVIFYLKVDGYDNIEDMKAAMFTNTTDSNAKTMVETWFEQQNLDGHIADTRNFENDLEDTVFCNDRTYYSGALKGKDSDATPSERTTRYSNHGAYGRNAVQNTQNNYEPSLDCPNSNDAFTKDSANGNGKLKHKIGLVTADELRMAGAVGDSSIYLYTGQSAWSASPGGYSGTTAEFGWTSVLGSGYSVQGSNGLRPLVSLKAGTKYASGTGTTADPYIVE